MEKALSFILIICEILSQGIFILCKENNGTSLDLHIRQKRVAGGVKQHINEAPFLVAILLRDNYHGPASLLSADTAITAAHVFRNLDQSAVTLESQTMTGAARAHHIVSLIFLDPNYSQTLATFKNLALVKFSPSIYFSSSVNRPISIHSGSIVHRNLDFQLVNWGKPFRNSQGKLVSIHHRSIFVKLISIEYCHEMYPGIIGPGNICTNSMNYGQHGTEHDSGAPLLAGQNLLGIMVYHGRGKATNPDVFMNLLDQDIRRWIHQHVPDLHLF